MGRSRDAGFLEEKLLNEHPKYTDADGDGLKFEVPKHLQDQLGDFSPPFWPRTQPTDFRRESSTTLPYSRCHHCKSRLPTPKLRAIRDRRWEITDMIKDVPESSYELSLKDIVEDKQPMDKVQEKEGVVQAKKMKHKMENRTPQKSNCQISRSESMESDVFLLKLFLPLSLSFSKKPKARKDSKICSGHRKPSEGNRRQANKGWWKMIALAVKDKQMSTKGDKRASGNDGNISRENRSTPREQRGWSLCGKI